MKKLLIYLTFISALMCNAQGAKQDLYIFVNQKPTIEVNNESLVFQKFNLDFDSRCNGTTINLMINELGNLEKNIKVKGTTNRIVSLIYKNKNKDNNALNVNREKIVNFLTYDEIICNLNIEKFMDIVLKFNVYLINK
ncbi:MAG TPA: hypothetical protein VF677_16445, partial [Flavobacterium sp.]